MLSKILEPITHLVRYQKKRILLFIGFFILFLYFLFPYNDLGDLVASKIFDATGGQVYVTFDKLDISLLPQPGLDLIDVSVDVPMAPRLSAKSVSIGTSLLGLLTFKPGVSLEASGFLGGGLDLTTRGAGKNTTGKMKQKVAMDLDRIKADELLKLTAFPTKIAGYISGTLESLIDPDFSDQPVSSASLQVNRAQLLESSVNTPLGPLDLPKLDLNDIVLEVSGEKGFYDITKLTIGKPGGDLNAQVTGKIEIRIQKSGAQVTPIFSSYNFNVQMQVGEGFKQKMATYLSLLQPFQVANNSYSMKISGLNMYSPPNITRGQ